ncbi:hypothetical protein GGR55DRAFT_654970 [Xylaria sp. FL0064]|nr:hypothetical protein GGR55DRAFT_654970 [Xylaria sp. FL0064]
MATVLSPVTNNLMRKDLRWTTLPSQGKESSKDIRVDDSSYYLLFFLRDLKARHLKWDKFIEILKNRPQYDRGGRPLVKFLEGSDEHSEDPQ